MASVKASSSGIWSGNGILIGGIESVIGKGIPKCVSGRGERPSGCLGRPWLPHNRFPFSKEEASWGGASIYDGCVSFSSASVACLCLRRLTVVFVHRIES